MTTDYTDMGAGTQSLPLLPSAPRTVTPNPQQVTFKGTVSGVIFAVNVTVAPASGSTLTPKLEGVDPQSQNTYPIILASGTSQVVAATGLYVYKVRPEVPAATVGTVQSAQDIVPETVRLTLTQAGGGSYTYSVTVIAPNN